MLAWVEEVWGDRDDAARWLKAPNPDLEGRTPLELLGTEQGARSMQFSHGSPVCDVAN